MATTAIRLAMNRISTMERPMALLTDCTLNHFPRMPDRLPFHPQRPHKVAWECTPSCASIEKLDELRAILPKSLR